MTEDRRWRHRWNREPSSSVTLVSGDAFARAAPGERARLAGRLVVLATYSSLARRLSRALFGLRNGLPASALRPARSRFMTRRTVQAPLGVAGDGAGSAGVAGCGEQPPRRLLGRGPGLGVTTCALPADPQPDGLEVRDPR